jgi:hypothetical protein
VPGRRVGVPVTLSATISGAEATARAAEAKPKPKSKAKAKPLVVGTVHTSIAAGRTLAVTFKLTAKGRSRLARHRKLRIAIAGSASTGTGGPKLTIARSITISEPAKPKKKHR